jgi:hypothetical protein
LEVAAAVDGRKPQAEGSQSPAVGFDDCIFGAGFGYLVGCCVGLLCVEHSGFFSQEGIFWIDFDCFIATGVDQSLDEGRFGSTFQEHFCAVYICMILRFLVCGWACSSGVEDNSRSYLV